MTTESTQQREGPSLSKRAFWIMFAKTLAFAFNFALPLVLVRRLSQAEFGLYKQAFLVVSTAMVVLQLNFGMSAFYFLPREGAERQRQIVFNVLLFNTLAGSLALLVLLLWPGLLEKIFNSPALVEYAALIGVVILLWVVSAFLEIVAVAHQELRLATFFIIASQVSRTTLLLAAALVAGTVRSLIYAAVVQGALQTVILIVYLRSRFRTFWRGFEWGVMRTQLAYALPFAGAGLLYTAQVDLHNYFVSNRFGEAAFAIYSVGCFQLPLVGILAESIGSVMIPRMSELQKEGRAQEIVRLTARATRKLAAIYFPLYLFLMLIGQEFIVLLFREQYAASWPVFAVNLTLLPFNVVALDPIVRAFTEQRYYLLRLRVVTIVLLVVALWFSIERFGLVGAISVVVAIGLIERFAVAWRFGRLLGVSRRDWPLLADVWKLGAAALVAGAAAAFVKFFVVAGMKPFVVIVACGAAFSLCYLAAVILLRVPSDEERETFTRRVRVLRRLGFGKTSVGVAGEGSAPVGK
ncbi:MAG TPA: oligosaccharide flippase family protein [Pyrinomonadaceae bacterium]|nr:oligosaccharide flippase family protein [Pyrinomonadaceae bacterium]